MKRFPALLLVFLVCAIDASANFNLDLHSGWKFRQSESKLHMDRPATVPGTVHTDLLANGVISDPFLNNNESRLQWIGESQWTYTTTFECTRSMLKEEHIELQFEGLDTYAFVYLNDSLLFVAENMFLSYTKDVKKYLRKKNNLRIVFHPASELIEKNKRLSLIRNYPGGDRVFIRKAQYQFGWDWGPKFITAGIWKPVHLVGWSGMRITDPYYKLEFLDKDTAFMMVDFMFEADKAGKYDFILSDGDRPIYGDQYSYSSTHAEHLEIRFKIPHPELWWCNGLGEQPLYSFTLKVKKKKKQFSVTTVTGIRKIELSTDRIDSDGGFYFLLNDVRVYAMGANWIPSDNFIPRAAQDRINTQLRDMKSLNMNMVRVWGGGVYESDAFYAQCDSLGLMVWQDLMFACSMYPYAVLDRDNLLMKEVIDNQRRIGNHPSISLWCGDNENKEGWFNWGWQKQFNYSHADSLMIINEYKTYHEKFLGCLKLTDKFFPYVMSSPQNGWGNKVAYERGDVHYWGVWWGMEPFSAYRTHTGRFVSEFGFQSAPSLHTFRAFGATSFANGYQDSIILAHQKHPTGYQTIDTYMERDYGITPKTFEEYVYLSQVLQYDALTAAIESQRKSAPVCMGSLFWQYNDCWPVTSWSVQDYYGRKKLAWYGLKRLYGSVLITVQERADELDIWIVNQSGKDIDGAVFADWQTYDGKSKWAESLSTLLPAHSSQIHMRIPKKELFDSLSAENGVLILTYQHNQADGPKYNDRTTYVFGREIDHNYPVAQPKFSFVRYITAGPMMISITSPVYLRRVMITSEDPDAEFSDNGFDILPGETYTVKIKTSQPENVIREGLRFYSINNLVAEEKNQEQDER